jgi:sigma-E factor negative regulatory protein RseC
MENVIGHKGVVISVSETEVYVKIERSESCGGCKNKASCRMGKEDEQIIPIETKEANTYSAGEEVNISMKTSLGLKATLYAYLLPLALLLIVFITVYQFTSSELIQILFAFFAVILYYFLLYKMRHRMKKTFQFFISKNGI